MRNLIRAKFFWPQEWSVGAAFGQARLQAQAPLQAQVSLQAQVPPLGLDCQSPE